MLSDFYFMSWSLGLWSLTLFNNSSSLSEHTYIHRYIYALSRQYFSPGPHILIFFYISLSFIRVIIYQFHNSRLYVTPTYFRCISLTWNVSISFALLIYWNQWMWIYYFIILNRLACVFNWILNSYLSSNLRMKALYT